MRRLAQGKMSQPTLVRSLMEAERAIEAWRRDYNEMRPYAALKDLASGEFAQRSSV